MDSFMRSVNPATGQEFARYPIVPLEHALARLALGKRASCEWRAAGFTARASVLEHAAALLRERVAALGRLATLEMGKPLAQAEAEVEKCAWTCAWYAGNGERLLADEAVETDATRSAVACEPLGVVLAVMPWNFPFWQVFRAAAPALMAGNVVALKHASHVPGVALAIERLLRDAGAPEGVFSTLLSPARDVGALIESPDVAAVTLTGSEAAGAEVAAHAGRALKKCVLELGGSDPFIVLDDADLEAVIPPAVLARVQNNGQSCIAAKRFLVAEPLAEAFTKRLSEAMGALVVGDPLDPATQVGPLARRELVDALERQVRESVAAGARVRAGGGRLDRAGFFHAPTVLDRVTPGMPAAAEETFGPLAPVMATRDDAHAVSLANATRFGLGASIWSRDAARGEALARAIEAGAVFVNGIVKSDPRLPFGGIKQSGYGRELGAAGLREFVNLKTLWRREG